MKYELVLVGGKSIVVSEDEKNVIERVIREKEEDTIAVGHNVIKTGTIRGIFEIEENKMVTNGSNQIDEINREFNNDCELWRSKPVEEKTMRELSTRVFPEAFIQSDWIKYTDELYEKVKTEINRFFTNNINSPRCPARVWFPLLKESLSEKTARFYEIVNRNDNVVLDWVKFKQKTLPPQIDLV